MKRKPARHARLGEQRPSIFAWMEMVARMEATCTILRDHNHPVRGPSKQPFRWECPRCNDLQAQALIHATVKGDVRWLDVLERLLDALGETGEKAA